MRVNHFHQIWVTDWLMWVNQIWHMSRMISSHWLTRINHSSFKKKSLDKNCSTAADICFHDCRFSCWWQIFLFFISFRHSDTEDMCYASMWSLNEIKMRIYANYYTDCSWWFAVIVHVICELLCDSQITHLMMTASVCNRLQRIKKLF